MTQGPLKVISDGSLNTLTAFCLDAYAGVAGPTARHPQHRDRPARTAHGPAHAAGLRCAIHAIGDPANALALDAFAASGARGSVEHAQLLRRADVRGSPRSASPPACSPSTRWTTATSPTATGPAAPPARSPLAALPDAGVAAGSRFRRARRAARPVDHRSPPPSPLRDDRPPWHPEQGIDVRVALEASVDGRALAVSAAAPADLVVLDADPLTPAQLRTMPVAGTLLGGGGRTARSEPAVSRCRAVCDRPRRSAVAEVS